VKFLFWISVSLSHYFFYNLLLIFVHLFLFYVCDISVNTEPIPCPDGSEIVCGKCCLLCLHVLCFPADFVHFVRVFICVYVLVFSVLKQLHAFFFPLFCFPFFMYCVYSTVGLVDINKNMSSSHIRWSALGEINVNQMKLFITYKFFLSLTSSWWWYLCGSGVRELA